MFFELFSYVEGIVNPIKIDAPIKIDTVAELAKDLDNGTLVQEDVDVDGELAVSENEFQADKDFGNPVEGDGAWKSFSSIGEEFMQGGGLNRNVPNIATYSIGATVVERHNNPNPILKMANGGAVRHHVPNTVTHSVGATVVDMYHKNPIVHVPSTVTHSVGATVVEYGKGGKVRKTQQSGESNEAYDELAKSKGVGYRFTDKKAKKLGKKENAKPTKEEIKKFKDGKGVYFENRKNRSDVSRMKKLEEGGEA